MQVKTKLRTLDYYVVHVFDIRIQLYGLKIMLLSDTFKFFGMHH